MIHPFQDWNFPDSDRREDQILAHAFDLVRESGLASLTMKKVAERVGFTEAAAYRYFPTKRSLVEGLLERLGGLFVEGVRAIAEDPRMAPAERLERVVRRHIQFISRTEGLPILILAEAAATADTELLAKMRLRFDAYLAILDSLLPDSAPGPEGLRPHDKALLLFGLPAVLAIRQRMGGDPEAEEGIPSRVLPFVIRCLTGDDGSTRASAPGGGS